MIEKEFQFEKQPIHLLHELLRLEDVPHYSYDKPYEEAKNDPILVMHTSGSTGSTINNTYTRDFQAYIIKVYQNL